MIAAVAADETHARIVLVREHPPAVDLLLIDPAVAVEWLAHLRGSHRSWRVSSVTYAPRPTDVEALRSTWTSWSATLAEAGSAPAGSVPTATQQMGRTRIVPNRTFFKIWRAVGKIGACGPECPRITSRRSVLDVRRARPLRGHHDWRLD